MTTRIEILNTLRKDPRKTGGERTFWKALRLFQPSLFYRSSDFNPFDLGNEVISVIREKRPDLTEEATQILGAAISEYAAGARRSD